ncbi:biotin-dependent carboxyltransferase family protein [Microbaculum marinum]|uniref:Biotin-dependent carboxyltransferase family protein n=1 Tax=Microbaculum marinum TaxID=1764581 RepID=A0AAW9RHM3_9HYPH
MFEVINPGLETSVQELPGRIGYWEQGFPPSGPMDIWSFRLANLLVGNAREAAALECQFLGPALKFHDATVIAVTGADMKPTLDGEPVPMWESVAVSSGQTLELGPALLGARAYIAVAGGLDTPQVLGSRSTFHMAGVGGIDGHAIQAGQRIETGVPGSDASAGKRVKSDARPTIDNPRRWDIEVVPGPNDDWIDAEGQRRFLESDWKLLAKSNRTGFRLEGPEWSFTDRATNKRPEHGQDPSNILDHGYPFGSVNLAGQTPIILVNDGPSTGGFINPYTVITAAFWKLAQSLPGDVYRFRAVTLEEAQALRRELDLRCRPESLEAA